MSDRDNGGPAFPVGSDYGPATNIVDGGLGGMSLRDYFAAAALPAAMHDWCECDPKYRDKIAEVCYQFADAMLAARANNG